MNLKPLLNLGVYLTNKFSGRRTLREPLPSQVMAGYMITVGVKEFTDRMTTALKCIDTAIADMNNDGVPTDWLEAQEAKSLIYAALADVHDQAERAHKILAEIMISKGYRKIISSDYAPYGVTRR